MISSNQNLKKKMFKTIETLRKGEIFRFPNFTTVYVYNGYNRSTKKFSYYKYFDISAFYEKKRGTMVETNFNF